MEAPWNQLRGDYIDYPSGKKYDGHLDPSKRESVRDAFVREGRYGKLEAQADKILDYAGYTDKGQWKRRFTLECLAPGCGKSFASSQPHTRTCSPACRARLSRATRDVKAQVADAGSWGKVQERLASDARFAERLRVVAVADAVSDSGGYQDMEHSYPVSEDFMNDKMASPLWGDPDWSNPEEQYLRKEAEEEAGK